LDRLERWSIAEQSLAALAGQAELGVLEAPFTMAVLVAVLLAVLAVRVVMELLSERVAC
jgi:uncharacterized membrane protein